MKSARWAIFLSGAGSNFQAALDQLAVFDLRLVLSDRSRARGLVRARRMGVPVALLKKPLDWDAIFDELKRRRINGLYLLGFMRIVPGEFIERWERQGGFILNLHPSLLPSYPGLHSLERAFADRAKLGVTIHHVIPEVDAGPMILQKELASRTDLAAAEFALHRLEHRMVRKVIEKWKWNHGTSA